MAQDGEQAPELQAPPGPRGTVELPAVVLSDERPREAPRRRLLPGRVDRRWCTYPAYLTSITAGALVLNNAVETGEWHPAPVALAWGMLFVWQWVYAAADAYRRALLKPFSAFMVTALAALLFTVSLERAAPQTVARAAALVPRESLPTLKWAAAFTLASAGAILAHLVFLGRGYRAKKDI